ncbi:MAG TPA: hypothetical protein VFG25_04390 [Nitrosopumilaceae archaeon]|nr:hypothetical protein [Nitrosopumilaceae archaeon]
MPGQGYSTIGLKPSIIQKLHEVTDEYFPGMFVPSTLIILMNEIKRGYFSVDLHDVKIDLGGRYSSITIRSDVKQWLEDSYSNLADEYEKKYRTTSFAQFLSYFLLNLLESKSEAQNHVIKLNASDFKWLVDEYRKKQEGSNKDGNFQTFESFSNEFLKELLYKVNEAKKILTS